MERKKMDAPGCFSKMFAGWEVPREISPFMHNLTALERIFRFAETSLFSRDMFCI